MKLKSKDDYIFISLLITSILIIIFTLIYNFFLYRYISVPSCFFFDHFGLYCPGCGCTRAFLALLNLDFDLSLYYNPVVIYCVIILFIYFCTQTVDRLLKHSKFIMPYSNWYGYIGIFIMIIHCVYRNYLLLFYGITL